MYYFKNGICDQKKLNYKLNYLNSILVLDDVPCVLEHKAIFTLYGNDIKEFVHPLIELVQKDSKHPEILFNLPDPDPSTGRKFSKGDFQSKVYPVLAAIAPYADYLETNKTSFSQSKVSREIVTALQNGLLEHKECKRPCIVALTACSLEMKKTMHNMIENVLTNFSRDELILRLETMNSECNLFLYILT